MESGSTALVTGALGFIGQNLTQHLVRQGIKVLGIGHGSLPQSHVGDLGLSAWINGDIELANLQQLRAKHGEIHSIFHLAGGSHVGRSFDSPAEDFNRTVVAGAQLLEWVRQSNPGASVIVVSSAAVYGSGHSGAISEHDNLNPFSPYGAHKHVLESLCRSYCSNFGLKIIITRLFSVYGQGLTKQLVFDVCQKLHSTPDRIVFGGNGNEMRDWIHVSDIARLLCHLQPLATTGCSILNGGTGKGTPVREIVEQINYAWGADALIEFSGNSRPGDPESLVADSTALKETGFQIEVPTEDGLKQVVDWYKSVWCRDSK